MPILQTIGQVLVVLLLPISTTLMFANFRLTRHLLKSGQAHRTNWATMLFPFHMTIMSFFMITHALSMSFYYTEVGFAGVHIGFCGASVHMLWAVLALTLKGMVINNQLRERRAVHISWAAGAFLYTFDFTTTSMALYTRDLELTATSYMFRMTCTLAAAILTWQNWRKLGAIGLRAAERRQIWKNQRSTLCFCLFCSLVFGYQFFEHLRRKLLGGLLQPRRPFPFDITIVSLCAHVTLVVVTVFIHGGWKKLLKNCFSFGAGRCYNIKSSKNAGPDVVRKQDPKADNGDIQGPGADHRDIEMLLATLTTPGMELPKSAELETTGPGGVILPTVLEGGSLATALAAAPPS